MATPEKKGVTALVLADARLVTSSGESLALMCADARGDGDDSVGRFAEAIVEAWQDAFREATPDGVVLGNANTRGSTLFGVVHGLAVLVNAGIALVDGRHVVVGDVVGPIIGGSVRWSSAEQGNHKSLDEQRGFRPSMPVRVLGVGFCDGVE